MASFFTKKRGGNLFSTCRQMPITGRLSQGRQYAIVVYSEAGIPMRLMIQPEIRFLESRFLPREKIGFGGSKADTDCLTGTS